MARREPVSIICVFNSPDVLRDCLARSVSALQATAPETELIVVDNTARQFSTAGAALGSGAARARHRVVAFAHQDVVLHSLVALEEAAAVLDNDAGIGMTGCCGIDRAGRIQGRIRDRVVLIGDPAPCPVPVDSLDEVLFMVRTEDVRREPLSTDPDLAWHAYAVEYGIRVRAGGRSVVALDVPLTHNSLTVNLDRLDVAHAAVARTYPESLPVRTTCGIVHAPAPAPGAVGTALRPHRWRYRWLRESFAVQRGSLQAGARSSVLADIRLDVDDVAAPDSVFEVVNVDDGTVSDGGQGVVEVTRRGTPFRLRTVPLEGAISALADLAEDTSLLVTNLRLEDLGRLRLGGSPAPHVLGFATDLGYWLLLGPAVARRPAVWGERRHRPASGPLLTMWKALAERRQTDLGAHPLHTVPEKGGSGLLPFREQEPRR
jgi:hypothetical protein